jgi:hypothetical protein
MARRPLDAFERELCRRLPAGEEAVTRLSLMLGCSTSTVRKHRAGARGLPGKNGLGSRPWLLKNQQLLDRWRARELQRVERTYQQASEQIADDQPITPPPSEDPEPDAQLFRGIRMKPVHNPVTAKPAPDPFLLFDRRS